MEKLRLGVIGVGSVVREIYQHLYYHSDYSHLLDVAAVADPNDQFRNWFCDTYDIPADRRFNDYRDMLDAMTLDAVQVNTPDHIHAGPTITALEAGLDVMIPKPMAATVRDAHAMIEAARKAGRLMGVDFHKREDPRVKEVEARYQSGRYGRIQSTAWYMLDKLHVANPNVEEPFFASPDFAEKNTPISFLTVHMCDALMKAVSLLPVEGKATGYSHKLPSLSPIPVKGFDLCDTEMRLENGALAHIITGWHLPDTAYATTVQSSRLICSDGMIDLNLDKPGYHEVHADGIFEVNAMFLNFERGGMVTGYGMSSPGRIYQKFLADRNGQLSEDAKAAMMTPMELGFYATLVCEAAEESLRRGDRVADGVTAGPAIGLRELCVGQLGEDATGSYLRGS